jgi:hypothetical protein
VSLVARHLEAMGIPTLCVGSARDILEAGRPPRSVFVDYPLGHSAGKPFDPGDQDRIVRMAIGAFETATESGPIFAVSAQWSNDDAWRAQAAAGSGGDVRMPRDTSPQYQTEEDRRLAEGR